METKELKITPPEGYEIDRENSTFDCIKFKKKVFTYKDVAKALFKDKYYYIEADGRILKEGDVIVIPKDANVATSEKQLEKLLAINKLLNVKNYLCPNFKPKKYKPAYSFYIDVENGTIRVVRVLYANYMDIFFDTAYHAQQAIDILGEDTIRLALSTDW